MAAVLINIGIGGSKYPTNNNILLAVQNETPSDNAIKQIVRQAQKNCYMDVAMNLESGMLLELAFGKVEIGGLGRFVKEATIFDHSADKIISIRCNSDGAKGKDREAAEAIYDTLYDVYIYCKYVKLTKDVCQYTDSVGG